MRFQTTEKKIAWHLMGTRFYSTLEEKIRQELLQTTVHRIFWKEESPNFPKPFVGFVQSICDKTLTSLKSFVLVSYAVHAMLLNFSKEYNRGCSKLSTV